MAIPRPRSVTLGCVYGGFGAAIVAIMLIETLSNWGSIELQDALRSGLSRYGESSDLDALLPVLRWVCLLLLVGAIAAAVFAVYAAKGHQASRIGLSVLAGGAGMTFLAAGLAGFLPALVAALIVYLLWNAPARYWYAVMNGREPVAFGVDPAAGTHSSLRDLTDPARLAAPPAADPITPRPSDATGPHIVPPPPYVPTELGDRPRSVRIALTVAGIGSTVGAVASGFLALMLVLLHDRIVQQYSEVEFFRTQLEAAGTSPDQMVTLGTWIFAGWLLISLLGVAATLWASTGRRSGWWSLVVISIVTAGCAALGLPLGAIWILGAIVVLVQLGRPESRAWFTRG